jgi:hypothetical protein
MGLWRKPIPGIVILFRRVSVMTKNARRMSDIPLPRQSAVSMSSIDDPGLDADQRGRLGARLRAMFQEIVTEPLPDRFQRLLEELARKERIDNDQQ